MGAWSLRTVAALLCLAVGVAETRVARSTEVYYLRSELVKSRSRIYRFMLLA